jgi:ribosomal protein L11 methyltransferase
LPYRIDIAAPSANALDLLVELGALDLEQIATGVAAILPDAVNRHSLPALFGQAITISEAVSRDGGSTWLLQPRPVQIGSDTIRLIESSAFGTGYHPTTALCIEALQEIVTPGYPNSALDVGTGSGILALVALRLGVPRVLGIDIDPDALAAAAENARLNQLSDRLQLMAGSPGMLDGHWPLIVANVLAAPLVGMAPALVSRLGTGGRLVLSGIQCSLEPEVCHAYQRLGIRNFQSRTREGWAAVSAEASW